MKCLCPFGIHRYKWKKTDRKKDWVPEWCMLGFFNFVCILFFSFTCPVQKREPWNQSSTERPHKKIYIWYILSSRKIEDEKSWRFGFHKLNRNNQVISHQSSMHPQPANVHTFQKIQHNIISRWSAFLYSLFRQRYWLDGLINSNIIDLSLYRTRPLPRIRIRPGRNFDGYTKFRHQNWN